MLEHIIALRGFAEEGLYHYLFDIIDLTYGCEAAEGKKRREYFTNNANVAIKNKTLI